MSARACGGCVGPARKYLHAVATRTNDGQHERPSGGGRPVRWAPSRDIGRQTRTLAAQAPTPTPWTAVVSFSFTLDAHGFVVLTVLKAGSMRATVD